MNEDKNKFRQWIKDHKKELTIAGISTTMLILLVLAVKNRAELAELMRKVTASLSKTSDSAAVNAVCPVNIDACAHVSDVTSVVSQPVQNITSGTQVDRIPFEVSKHIRNLPDGYHASPEKVATALENGIQLLDNQTWVMNYTKGMPIAV